MSGRPRSIDRDKVLDAAEAIVMQDGASGLSFDAVARAAGITKSGVQYCFGTKENMIRAIIDRWGTSFDAQVESYTGPDPTPRAIIRGHLAATRDSDDAEYARSAVMMTALLQRPDRIEATRRWYNQRIAGLDMSKKPDRDAAVAFLAGEGAFLLSALGLIDLDNAQWDALFADILKLAGEPDAQHAP